MFLQFQTFFHLKLNYFQQFWSLIDLGIIGCSWSIVGVYVWLFRELNRINSLFAQTNGYIYINLQLAVYINDLLTYLFGFCCFFGTIKFVRLCRYNQRLVLFTETLKLARKELISFLMMFFIVFFSFICLFYLLFNSNIWSCSSLLGTAEMLFEILLMQFDASQFTGAAAFLGPFSFSLFIFLVVFVCMSMFLSIITDNFRLARENSRKNKEEIFSFIWNRFQRWTGEKRKLD